MSAPIILSIIQSMQAALQTISRASGYFHDVQASSVSLDAVTLTVTPSAAPFTVLGHRLDPVERDFAYSKPNRVKDRWRITLETFLFPLGTGAGRGITARTQWDADVERALTVDPFRGGLALMTYVLQSTAYTDLETQTGILVVTPVEVLYGRIYGQP